MVRNSLHTQAWQLAEQAEIELSALTPQCLNHRIPDQETVDAEVQAWVDERNDMIVKVNWRFTTTDARIKLKHLYPKIQV